MKFWNLFLQTINPRPSECIEAKINEMILIIKPRGSAQLTTEPGSRIVVTGFAGTIWIQIAGRELGYTLRHGESFEIPEAGKLVFWAATENVTTKVHVEYQPAAGSVH